MLKKPFILVAWLTCVVVIITGFTFMLANNRPAAAACWLAGVVLYIVGQAGDNRNNTSLGFARQAQPPMERPVSREDVYDAIDGERAYQDGLARNDVKQQTPMEHLAIIDRIVSDMKDCWYDRPGQPSMDFMRKIAGTAVRCMEQHGAPRRTS